MLYAVLRTSWTRGPAKTLLRPVGVSSLFAAATATRRTFLTTVRVETPSSSTSSKSSKTTKAADAADADAADTKAKAKAKPTKAKVAKAKPTTTDKAATAKAEKAKAAKEKAKAARQARAEAKKAREKARTEARKAREAEKRAAVRERKRKADERMKRKEKEAAERVAKQNAKKPFRKPMNAFNNFVQQRFPKDPASGKYAVPEGSNMAAELANAAREWAALGEEEKKKYAVDPKLFEEYSAKLAEWRASLTRKERSLAKKTKKSSGVRGVNVFFKENFPKSLEGTTFADVARALRARYSALSDAERAVYDERARTVNAARKEEEEKEKAEKRAAREAASAAASAAAGTPAA